MSLAIDSYERLETLTDDPDILNLAWTVDEREHLGADLLELCARELSAEVSGALPYLTSYLVKDPYGEGVLGPAVARHLGDRWEPVPVTCGAGVGPLLQSLVRLAGSAPVYVAGDVYPDLPHWVEAADGRCVGAGEKPGEKPDDDVVGAHVARVRRHGARLVAMERPALTTDGFTDLAAVSRLCAELSADGVVVLVDESNANYCPPGFSAARLVSRTPNLIVVRGLSKAFGMGGLRLGYCLSAPALTGAVRRVVAPLLASSLSLRLGAAILRSGDLAAPLRRRIAERRAEAGAALAAAGWPSTTPASEFLPYHLLDDDPAGALAALRGRGIVGKLHPVWSASSGTRRLVARLSVPLSDVRMERLRHLLARSEQPLDRGEP
ncbi:aminotransferase class I/II-fold pyridoxal phosphate-dependent enzyme [Streptosporangium sp. NPDC049376]|uniref:aminotransferase class I/II-fold pyridoxal phosphate-dependent enzyme n=1 Tax=Streptosporangium sp. NPDC049376 TaxID=3366192 RepID=UPI0037B4352B